MTGPTATCELWIDGDRVADQGVELISGLATALSGLSISWGRDGQNEQPGSASCTMDFVDPAGSDNILDVLHVGSEVEVWAEGEYDSGTGYEETFDDPSMNSWTIGDAEALLYVAPDADQAIKTVDTGDGNIALDLQVTSKSSTVSYTRTLVPPRHFSPTAQLPNAWDDIPQWQPFARGWQYSVDVLAPAGAQISLALPIFTSPYPTASTGQLAAKSATATGQWQTIAGTVGVASGIPAGWMGINVLVNHPGQRWMDRDSAETWASVDDQLTWETVTRVRVDNTSVKFPLGTVTRRVLVFSGSVSDVTLTPDYTYETSIRATAMDLGSKLGNTVIGDSPWPVQTAQVRADRIAQLAGITSSPRIRIDDTIETKQLSYRDVDAQIAFELLQDVAQSIGGVLWCATHAVTGAYLWIEDPAHRAAVRSFVEQAGKITIGGNTGEGVSVLSACDIVRDDVAWRQDTADVITVAAVTWQEQGVNTEGEVEITERTVTTQDADAVALYGTRRLSIGTELITQADATDLATRVMAQARAVAWRLDGLQLDTYVVRDEELTSVDDATREITLLNLLDGTSRMGAAVTLVDMPSYAPRGAISSAYVEGGTYAFEDGYWRLRLTTTPSAGQGESATWQQIGAAHPTWLWSQWDSSVQWVDTYGVTA